MSGRELTPGVGLPVPPADGPKDQKDLPSNLRFDTLADEMMLYRPSRGVNYSPFRLPNLNPQEFLANLGDAVPEGLLISDGEEMPKPSEDSTVRLADSRIVNAVTLVAHRFREHGGVRRLMV